MTTTDDARKQWQERELQRVSYLAEELANLFSHGGADAKTHTLRDTSPAVLAQWRRALSRNPGAATELAGPISNILKETPAHSAEEYAWEFALHYALGLFAFHQQSASVAMHAPARPGHPPNSVGNACRELARLQAQNANRRAGEQTTLPQYEPVNRGLVRRIDSVVSARTPPELVGHLRGLVPLLRGRGIGLDYVVLAADLAAWFHSAGRDRTSYRWGRDFHRPFLRRTPPQPPTSSDARITDNSE